MIKIRIEIKVIEKKERKKKKKTDEKLAFFEKVNKTTKPLHNLIREDLENTQIIQIMNETYSLPHTPWPRA